MTTPAATRDRSSNAPRAKAAFRQIRRVLVTTDLSAIGDSALPYAGAVAPPDGTVRLIHVAHPRAIGGGEFERGLQRTKRHTSHVDGLERRLRRLARPFERSGGRLIDVAVIEHAHTAKGICEEAERFDADVIVMASHGVSGLRRAVVGSVAHAVMTNSQRPVLVIRSPA